MRTANDSSESHEARPPGFASPPVILAALAPAPSCNQRCPQCLIDLLREPARQFGLRPADYARFVEQFIEARIPIVSATFQGFEVTLSRSFPYVEAMFSAAHGHGIWRGFVTNGMLLAKRTSQIVALDVDGISVSLDGASPEVNDPIRGLKGAFDRALAGLGGFLDGAPHFVERIEFASTVYDETNARSLVGMPKLLKRFGIRSWSISCALEVQDGTAQKALRLREWIPDLLDAADAEGIHAYTSDEFGFFEEDERSILRARNVFNPDFMYRLDPVGYVRSGKGVLDVWDPRTAARWDPRTDNAVDTVGYWGKAAPFLEANR